MGDGESVGPLLGPCFENWFAVGGCDIWLRFVGEVGADLWFRCRISVTSVVIIFDLASECNNIC